MLAFNVNGIRRCSIVSPPRVCIRAGNRLRRCSAKFVDGRREKVPRTAFGLDALQTRRIFFDLATQPENLDIDGSAVHVVVKTARLEKLFARQNPSRRSQKSVEQTEFTVGQS
jgi:hypothetical protein